MPTPTIDPGHGRRRPRPTRFVAMLLALVLVAAACGDDDDDAAAADDAATTTAAPTTTESETTEPADTDPADTESADTEPAPAPGFPVTIDSAAGTFTLDDQPQRIISLSPSATEILFAIGAGDQVVAVDQFSYFPAEAPVTDLSGFDPNVEAITAFEPDLVVIANDANDLVASLTALDIPVLVDAAPIDLDSGYDGIAALGVATGRVDETAEVITDLRSGIEAAIASAPDTGDTPIRIYHELDDTYFSASSFGFIGAVYAALGTENIADEADTDGFGFPQLTEEYIVTADPQLIVITDQVGYTPDDVAARPGWGEISAVANGNIVTVNADIASRWGPRLPQFIEAVASALTASTVES